MEICQLELIIYVRRKKGQAQKVWLYSIIRGDLEGAFLIQENQSEMSRTKESKYSHSES